MISKVRQLVIPLADAPGTLAELCGALGDEKVNILAILAPETKEEGRVRVMVDDMPRAREVLTRAKIGFSEEEALDIELDNRPGAFGQLAGRFAAAKINIRYAYATTTSFGRARVIVAVRDPDKALAALGG